MFKIIGYERKQGQFPNKETGEIVKYDNYELYYVTDEKDNLKGLFADGARAKAEELQIIGAKDLDEALNKEVYLISDLLAKPDENGRVRVNINKIVVIK